jgi:hypothetical protein
MSKKLLLSVAPLLVTVAFAAMPAVSQATPQFYKNNTLIKSGENVPTISWGTLNLAAGGTTVTCQNAALAYILNVSNAGKGETVNFATANCSLSTGECKPSQGLEVVVTAEELPWGLELEEGTFSAKPTVRQRTLAEPPGTPGFASGYDFLSTEGAQVTTHCVFRGKQPVVKQLAESLCGHAFPGTGSATIYEPAGRTVIPVEAIGFETYVIEAETSCSGAGLATEEGEVARRPSTAGDPAKYNVPGVAVAPCEGENAPHLKNGTSAKAPSEILFDQNGNNGGKGETSTTGTLVCEGVGPGTTTGSLSSAGYEKAEVITTK